MVSILDLKMKRTATLKLRLHGNFQKFKAKFISFKTTYCFKLFNMINKILYTTALYIYIECYFKNTEFKYKEPKNEMYMF